MQTFLSGFTVHKEKTKKYISKAATNFTCFYFGQPDLRRLPSCQASSPTFAGELSSGTGRSSHILDFQGHSSPAVQALCLNWSDLSCFLPVRKFKLSKCGSCPDYRPFKHFLAGHKGCPWEGAACSPCSKALEVAWSTSAVSRLPWLNCCGDRKSHLLFVPSACSLCREPMPASPAKPGWRGARLSCGAGLAAVGTGSEAWWPVCRWHCTSGSQLREGSCAQGCDGDWGVPGAAAASTVLRGGWSWLPWFHVPALFRLWLVRCLLLPWRERLVWDSSQHRCAEMILHLLLCLWWDVELQWSLWVHSSSGYFVIPSVLKGLGQATGMFVWSTGMGCMGCVQICWFPRRPIGTANLLYKILAF